MLLIELFLRSMTIISVILVTYLTYLHNKVSSIFSKIIPHSPILKYKTNPVTEEDQYTDLMRRILHDGVKKGDRTGNGTLSVFGNTMKFSLRGWKIPLLTTKKVFYKKGIVEELVWMLRGNTDSKLLSEKGVPIWDLNTTREFLDKRGLPNYEVGDIGPGYGFQWRHAGAEYHGCNADYKGKGIDQLKRVIDQLKNSPEDRRIIISSWSVPDLDYMALPPCHLLVQFYVANGELSCQVYQRSTDVCLGLPYNLGFYGSLCLLLASMCGYQPGDLTHVSGDTHIYLNHVDLFKKQLTRTTFEFPTVSIDPNIKTIEDIDNILSEEHFTLNNYKHHPGIKAPMAI